MTEVPPNETLFTDYLYSDRAQPCSMKFKTGRIQYWTKSISDTYDITPTQKSEGTLEFRIDSPHNIVILCHHFTGVFLIQGSGFFRWAQTEFPRLKSPSHDGAYLGDHLDNLLEDNKWVIASQPGDGHCLLHSVAAAISTRYPGASASEAEIMCQLVDQAEHNSALYLDLLRELDTTSDILLRDVRRYVNTQFWNLPTLNILPYMLANALNINIEVVNVDNSGQYYILLVQPASSSTQRCITVIRRNDHYDAVVLKPQSPSLTHVPSNTCLHEALSPQAQHDIVSVIVTPPTPPIVHVSTEAPRKSSRLRRPTQLFSGSVDYEQFHWKQSDSDLTADVEPFTAAVADNSPDTTPPAVVEPSLDATPPATVEPSPDATAPAAVQPSPDATPPAAVKPSPDATPPAAVEPSPGAAPPAAVEPSLDATLPTVVELSLDATPSKAVEPSHDAAPPAAVEPSLDATLPATVEPSTDAIHPAELSYEQLQALVVELREENSRLRKINSSLTTNIIKQQPPPLEEPASSNDSVPQKLIIGSSIIRDFDETKLHNTHVVAIGGAKPERITMILKAKSRDKETFSCITIVAGANGLDLRNPNEDNINDTLKDIEDTITAAKQLCNKVQITELPPRVTHTNAPETIAQLNNSIIHIAKKHQCEYIPTRGYFYMANGRPNQALLDKDKVHLSLDGSATLLECIDPSLPNPRQCIKERAAYTHTVPTSHANMEKTKSQPQLKSLSDHWKSPGRQAPNRSWQHPTPDSRQTYSYALQHGSSRGGHSLHHKGMSPWLSTGMPCGTWQHKSPPDARPGLPHTGFPRGTWPHRMAPATLQNTTPVRRPPLHPELGYCGYCGEPGHNYITCHHGRPVECNKCHISTHKAKFCHMYDHS